MVAECNTQHITVTCCAQGCSGIKHCHCGTAIALVFNTGMRVLAVSGTAMHQVQSKNGFPSASL